MEKAKNFFKETVIIVILALVISFFLRSFVIEARENLTGSMLPTIQVNQRILVNKLVYKFREPKRGEIILFSPPFKTEDNKDFIKRVIGLEGEKIEIKNGIVYINDTPLKEKYICDKANYDFGPVIVPENSLFVLGDNRNHSYDSHLWKKWLKIDQVKGKAFFTYWPLNKMGLLSTEVKCEDINN